MNLRGHWYPASQSAQHSAELVVLGNVFSLYVDGYPPFSEEASQLHISDRVGNIPRKLKFSDGSIFITPDNDVVDTWLAQSSHPARQVQFLHVLESRWRWIGLSLIATVAIVLASIHWGLPWVSKQMAYALPQQASEIIATGTLQTLDELMLKPSQLPISRQQAIQQHFSAKLLPLQHSGFTYTLNFRRFPDLEDSKGKDLANAFALPSGEIVVTDRLVTLAQNQQELDAVLLHEIGHVVYRHGLRQTIESSGLMLAILLVTGDASAIHSIAVGLPIFLLESRYSRDFEREADAFAFQHMMAAGIDPIHFAHIMQRIETDTEGVDVHEYLSSHPATPERIQQAKDYSRQFQSGH
ncbi:MAG: hypothetical protein BWK73_37550 [Thiothrix lacustris]|uniref:Uncharacterized protein n=1 Tax=Thiothrix lacustris TaxID=525917 RepID=A0A1Y1QEX5_9GAMM|nr:MAG: hypothetical protein BWK73_37550 [Thiothrix lacustris]